MIRTEYTSLDDFRFKEVKGSTHSSADTQSLHYHNSKEKPRFWIFLEGDAYIPAEGMGPNVVDVRSRLTSQAFRLLMFF